MDLIVGMHVYCTTLANKTYYLQERDVELILRSKKENALETLGPRVVL